MVIVVPNGKEGKTRIKVRGSSGEGVIDTPEGALSITKENEYSFVLFAKYIKGSLIKSKA
jgi:hypothetical protein